MRFEKSNEMIQNCNTIMNNHLQIIGPQLTEEGLLILTGANLNCTMDWSMEPW